MLGRVLADSFQGAGLVVEPDAQPNVPTEMDVIEEEDARAGEFETLRVGKRFVACVERQRVIFML